MPPGLALGEALSGDGGASCRRNGFFDSSFLPGDRPFDIAALVTQAIADNDVARTQELLTSNPELRKVLIDDVPLMAVAQPGRSPMMELLVRHGADVNGLRWGWFPVLFTPCASSSTGAPT